ncbi:MAG: M20/M25/M40 family metallo-hydrolase, partial [Vulcanimicrobiota bacterium]
ELTGKVKKYLVDLLGEDIVYDIEAPTMGAEDFAYFAQEKPTVFMRLGAGGPTGEEFNAPHHHPEFDIDEKAFINGAASFVKIALEFLK